MTTSPDSVTYPNVGYGVGAASAAGGTIRNVRPGGILPVLARTAAKARYNNPRVLPIMTSPPTVTSSASAPSGSGLTKSYRWVDSTNGVYNYYGGGVLTALGYLRMFPVTVAGVTNASWRVEVMVDSAKFAIGVYNSQVNKTVRITVDGQYYSSSLFNTPLAGQQYITVDFTAVGGRAMRRIVFESQGNTGFDGFYVGPTEGVYKVGGDEIKAMIVGDSYTQGVGTASGGADFPDGFAYVMADCLGIKNIWNSGYGSTGYVANAGGKSTNFIGRLPDLVAAAPDVIFVAGGVNDTGLGAGVLRTAVATYISAIRASPVLATTPIFVSGVFNKATGPNAAILSAEAEIFAAVSAAQANDPWLFYFAQSADVNGPWISGTGYVGATTGVGNSDIYTSSDGIHPTPAGALFLGKKYADAVMGILQNQLV